MGGSVRQKMTQGLRPVSGMLFARLRKSWLIIGKMVQAAEPLVPLNTICLSRRANTTKREVPCPKLSHMKKSVILPS